MQHALRAFTPEDQAALAKTVKTYPNTKDYDIEEALTSLGIGEAIVTVLSERGAPTPVAWTRMRAPRSLMAAIGADAMSAAAHGSPLHGKYGTTVDRESAYERLTAKIAEPPQAPPPPAEEPRYDPPPRQERQEPGMIAEVLGSPVVKSFLRSMGTQLGREITRGLFGTRRRYAPPSARSCRWPVRGGAVVPALAAGPGRAQVSGPTASGSTRRHQRHRVGGRDVEHGVSAATGRRDGLDGDHARTALEGALPHPPADHATALQGHGAAHDHEPWRATR